MKKLGRKMVAPVPPHWWEEQDVPRVAEPLRCPACGVYSVRFTLHCLQCDTRIR